MCDLFEMQKQHKIQRAQTCVRQNFNFHKKGKKTEFDKKALMDMNKYEPRMSHHSSSNILKQFRKKNDTDLI